MDKGAGIIAMIFMWLIGVVIALGICAFIAWVVAVLVTYLFGIDFGFWKAAAALILLSIVGSFFSGRVTVTKN